MSEFKIAAAQFASIRGDLAGNLRTHTAAIMSAAMHGISVLVFPELSLIGYEPDLADELAITPTDERLAPLATLARHHQIAVVVGASLCKAGTKPSLGAILLTADGSTRTYAKMHLGGTEPTYFAPGKAPLSFNTHGQMIGLAICADSSMASHPRAYADRGARRRPPGSGRRYGGLFGHRHEERDGVARRDSQALRQFISSDNFMALLLTHSPQTHPPAVPHKHHPPWSMHKSPAKLVYRPVRGFRP